MELTICPSKITLIEKNRFSLVALIDNILVDIFDRADVKTAGRVHGNEQIFVVLNLTRDDDLLLIAAGEGACRPLLAFGRTDVIVFDGFAGMLEDGVAFQNFLVRKRMFLIVLENQIVFNGEIQHETMLLTVGGNAGDTVFKTVAGRLVEHIHTVDQNLAGGALSEPGDDFDQLGLAVAVNAGNADDLASTDLQIQAFDDFNTAVVFAVQIFDIQNDFTGGLFRLVNPTKSVKFCAGRETTMKDFQGLLMLSGLDSVITGGYLTTRGREVSDDDAFIDRLRDF